MPMESIDSFVHSSTPALSSLFPEHAARLPCLQVCVGAPLEEGSRSEQAPRGR